MEDIKSIVAKNIVELRQAKGMTQLELAEKLNYSDKAVSKWEHAESTPDIAVLVRIAELFEVPFEYLVRAEHDVAASAKKSHNNYRYRRSVITALSILLVWFVAVFFFVLITLLFPSAKHQWLCYIYAIPASAIVWLVMNSLWFNPRYNYLIITLLMWSSLLSVHLSLLPFGLHVGLIYLLGIPGQIINLLWFFMKKRPKQD